VHTVIRGTKIAITALLATLWTAPAAYAKGASVDDATAEQSNAASDKYRSGTEAFEAGRFDVALGLFRASYDVVASPNSHLMIARALSRMGKNAEAYAEIESTIAEADAAAQKSEKYKKTAQTARAEQGDLSKKVGFVVVSVPAKVTVGGEPLRAGSLGRAVADPGKSEVVLKLESGEEVRRTVEVTAGEETPIELALPEVKGSPGAAAPAPAPECPPARTVETHGGVDQKTLAYVAGGVGALGFATFAVFGLLNNSKYHDLEDRCTGGVCPRSLSGDAETGRQYQAIANVGLGVGAVGLVTAGVLFFTAPPSHPESAHLPTTRVAVGPASVSLQGRF
jgi:hypothetical protein